MRFATIIGSLSISVAVLSTLVSAAPNHRTRKTKAGPTVVKVAEPYPSKPFPYIGGGEGIPATDFWGIPPAPTPGPEVAAKREAKANYDGQPFTIHIENTAGDSMKMNLKHNEDAPGALCCPHNDPLPSSTQVTYPTGWAGRISIGPVGDEFVITQGSTIEASFIDGKVFFDVSYVKGYTYPIVCSCQGVVMTGCNYPLLQHAAENGGCPSPGNKICYNPDAGNTAKERGSAAIDFFQPCQGAAFTYPHDYDANQYCPVNEISCCVGILCPPNPAQHKGKRDLELAQGNGTLAADTA